MAVNTHTLDNARRIAFYELIDFPNLRVGAGGILGQDHPPVAALLPYSRLVIDGIEYIETNGCATTGIPSEGGLNGWALPVHGLAIGAEYVSRSLGVRSQDVPTGVGLRTAPADIVLHRQGWI